MGDTPLGWDRLETVLRTWRVRMSKSRVERSFRTAGRPLERGSAVGGTPCGPFWTEFYRCVTTGRLDGSQFYSCGNDRPIPAEEVFEVLTMASQPRITG